VKYGSVCSGIEAATTAWHPLGWEPQWFSEIEKFPSDVLAHHYPNIPNLGDMTRIHEREEFNARSIELLVGGTPCQSFSVAGLRKGLDDPRGNLTLVFLSIASRSRARWVVWENVPGVLSDDGGRTFGTFLGGLAQLGYGFAYRVLDAQYFGVAQRRSRVFVVASLGDWRGPAAVLSERSSLSWNPPPSREQGKEVAGTLASRTSGGGGLGTDFECDGGLQVTHTLTRRYDSSEDGCGRGTPLVPVAFDTTQITSPQNRCNPKAGDPCHPLAALAHPPTIAFTSKDYGGDAALEIAPTLRAMNHDKSHMNGGGTACDSFSQSARPGFGADHSCARSERQWPRSLLRPGGQTTHAPRVRKTPGFPRRLHFDPSEERACGRWATIQGNRKLNGGSGHEMDW
jgi:DNA (cytosine-5)-methyltransferase 1